MERKNEVIVDLPRAKAAFQQRDILALLQKPLDAEAQAHVEGR
ncbi:hypothetical protein PAF17_15835 [Paracoccus sp. Z330]|uniref:Uncharacterized protein n=1 Tax=Paracoccus onchidii TaxID=3017813 RepID=A0ABT4ZI31_9RHOB|nr:hypothetical protein [Paracoccus onchidii]MDB6178962.1 hypothetical protein [Paracoccus onchidii]